MFETFSYGAIPLKRRIYSDGLLDNKKIILFKEPKQLSSDSFL
jgi:hypothetical protein